MIAIERFRSQLNDGVQMIGAAVTMNDIMAAELVSRHMDFLWIDMEHGALSIDVVEGHILAAKKNGKTTLVRVPKLDIGWIKMVLDAGAHGVIVPQLYSPEEFSKVVEYGRYTPLGKRGFGPRIPYEYGKMGSAGEYLAWANRNIYLAPQIETKEAYESLDEILTIDGYDAVCIGPSDLSISMGCDGDIDCTCMLDVYQSIIDRAKAAGKHVGFGMGVDKSYAAKIVDMGVDWLQIGSDFDYINTLSADIYTELKK